MEVIYRKSKQRQAILAYLSENNQHPTVEQIFYQIKKDYPSISLATVYRNLEQLTTMGKVLKIHDPQGPARYEAKTSNHSHVRCEKCGKLADVELTSDLKEIYGMTGTIRDFVITNYKITFYGVCKKCQGKPEPHNRRMDPSKNKI